MKVAIINTVIGTGSVGRIASGTGEEVRRRGGATLMCRGRGAGDGSDASYRIGSDADMYLHGIMSRITDKHGRYSRGATKALIAKLKEFSPDVIQLHNIHGYYVNYELLFSYLRSAGIPIVWTLHDCWSFTGHCVHFEYRGCEKWKTGECGSCPEKREYPASLLLDASAGNLALKNKSFTGIERLQIVTPSEYLKSKVRESILSEYPVKVINTGIDLNTFRPVESDIRQRYGIGDKTLLLFAAAPWRERKGLYDIEPLYKALDPDKYAFAVIGLTKKQIQGLPEGIIALERTESVNEMARWYSAADIYVNLTYEDTFPTTNIEALACGTYVISYDSGGSGESLTPGTGTLVKKKDIKALAAAIESRGGRGGEPDKDCIERSRLYDRDARFREYYELYEEI